jgi:hypothetical protein
MKKRAKKLWKISRKGQISIVGGEKPDGSFEFVVKVVKSQGEVYPEDCCILDAVGDEFREAAEKLGHG